MRRRLRFLEQSAKGNRRTTPSTCFLQLCCFVQYHKNPQSLVTSHGETDTQYAEKKAREMQQGEENIYRSTGLRKVSVLSLWLSLVLSHFLRGLSLRCRYGGVALCQQSVRFHFLSLSYCPLCLEI